MQLCDSLIILARIVILLESTSTVSLYSCASFVSYPGRASWSHLFVIMGASHSGLPRNPCIFFQSESSLATGNTLVKRDASGNFAAGTITATFAGNGSAITNLAAGNIVGTIPSNVLGNSNVFIGTTAIPLNRTTGTQTLNGVNISGSAATADNATRVGGRTIFAQNGTPTANAVGDIWFQVPGL